METTDKHLANTLSGVYNNHNIVSKLAKRSLVTDYLMLMMRNTLISSDAVSELSRRSGWSLLHFCKNYAELWRTCRLQLILQLYITRTRAWRDTLCLNYQDVQGGVSDYSGGTAHRVAFLIRNHYLIDEVMKEDNVISHLCHNSLCCNYRHPLLNHLHAFKRFGEDGKQLITGVGDMCKMDLSRLSGWSLLHFCKNYAEIWRTFADNFNSFYNYTSPGQEPGWIRCLNVYRHHAATLHHAASGKEPGGIRCI